MKHRCPITTHVLDLSQGTPARGLSVELEYQLGPPEPRWNRIGSGRTNGDGRVEDLLAPDMELKAGIYRLTFFVGPYFQSSGTESFYSEVPVVFKVHGGGGHYHVPLLLSPYGYSTYRGT